MIACLRFRARKCRTESNASFEAFMLCARLKSGPLGCKSQLINSSVHSFVSPLVRPFVGPCIYLCVLSCVCACVRPFVRPCVRASAPSTRPSAHQSIKPSKSVKQSVNLSVNKLPRRACKYLLKTPVFPIGINNIPCKITPMPTMDSTFD